MLLHETMEAAVADVRSEPAALAAASRRQGQFLRRRRHALNTAALTTAAAVLLATTWAVLPGTGNEGTVATDNTTAPSPTVDIGALSGATAPITDQGVATAFTDAVGDVATGAITKVQGQAVDFGGTSRDGGGPEASAELLLMPNEGVGPAGRVMVNLQPLAMGGPKPYTCAIPYMVDCTVSTLTGGDTLRTYQENGDTEFGGAPSQRAVAELLSPTRRIRVVVFAMNTNAAAKGTFRDKTVLDIDQLTAIATQPWWSRTRLPREYENPGNPVSPPS